MRPQVRTAFETPVASLLTLLVLPALYKWFAAEAEAPHTD